MIRKNPVHTALKDKREKRDELKEKKFQVQQTKAPDKDGLQQELPQVKE